MALRVAGYRVRFRRKPNFLNVIMGIIELVLSLFVGEKVINAVKNSINVNDTNAMFYPVYQLLGLTTGSTGGGLIGALGILGAAQLVMGFFKFSR